MVNRSTLVLLIGLFAVATAAVAGLAGFWIGQMPGHEGAKTSRAESPTHPSQENPEPQFTGLDRNKLIKPMLDLPVGLSLVREIADIQMYANQSRDLIVKVTGPEDDVELVFVGMPYEQYPDEMAWGRFLLAADVLCKGVEDDLFLSSWIEEQAVGLHHDGDSFVYKQITSTAAAVLYLETYGPVVMLQFGFGVVDKEMKLGVSSPESFTSLAFDDELQEYATARAELAERSLSATKGVVTRIKN